MTNSFIIKVENEFQVNTYINTNQSDLAIAGLTDDRFVIIWYSDRQDSHYYGVSQHSLVINQFKKNV